VVWNFPLLGVMVITTVYRAIPARDLDHVSTVEVSSHIIEPDTFDALFVNNDLTWIVHTKELICLALLAGLHIVFLRLIVTLMSMLPCSNGITLATGV